ncbi:MAG TPA: hypothetical protein VM779_07880 [Thermoanaerobaculia bacterium]|nr:hypothetical protein [Thermoanaerobaculia bacterium]
MNYGAWINALLTGGMVSFMAALFAYFGDDPLRGIYWLLMVRVLVEFAYRLSREAADVTKSNPN